MSRGWGEGDNGERRSSQGTCIKDAWTRTVGRRIKCGGGAGQGRVIGGHGDDCN